jgi:serine/threonine-protein kinase
MRDLDRAIAERAQARGLLDGATLERCQRLVEDRRAQGKRAYLAQVLVQEKVLAPGQLLELEDDIAAPVYECPKCQQRHTAEDVGRAGEKFSCKGCGKKVRLLERDRVLTQIEVLASKDPRDLTIPLRLASETGSATQVGEVDLERYQVEEELGRGGYGIVWKARHKDLDRPVALKVVRATDDLDATMLERFVREGRAASRLSHPNICHVYDIGRYKDLLALAMELVTGRALRDVINQDGALPWRRACEVLRGILAGIQHAHENGVIHRDLKPSNIIMEDGTGRPRIIDFGLAKDATARTELTGAGQILGTPYYLAPEQVEGRSHQVDARSDVFALGVIFYECLTAKRPFTAKLRSEVYAQILVKVPEPPSRLVPDIPGSLDAIVAKALAKLPEERFQSAKEFSDALGRALEPPAERDDEMSSSSKSVSKSRSRPPRDARKTAGRRVPSEPAIAEARRGNATLIAATVAMLVTVAVVLALRGSPEEKVAGTGTGAETGTGTGTGIGSGTGTGCGTGTGTGTAIHPSPVALPSPSPTPSPDVSPSPEPSAPLEAAVAAPSPSPDLPPPAIAPPEPSPQLVAPDPGVPGAKAPVDDDGKDDPREFPSLVEKNERDWVARAFTANFYADGPSTSASVRALRLALLDRHPLVRAFALRGLTLRTAPDLQAWGGHAVWEGLLANLRATKEEPYLARTARVVLAQLAGKDLGAKEEPWRAYWKESGRAAFESAASAHGPEAPPTIAVQAAQGEQTTREREVTTYFTQAREHGLECVICLDVTDSMTDKLARVRREIGQLTSFFSLLLPKKGRLGLVTFGDEVKDAVALTDNMRLFASEVEAKAVLWHDPKDLTVEEGPDKALGLCFDPKNALGWRSGTRKVLVLITDAPMHAEDVKDCYALVEKAASQGFSLNTVACDPPQKFVAKWPPWDQLKKLAELGKGIEVDLKDPKELMARLLVLTLGSKHEEDLRRFVIAYRDVTGVSSGG